MSGIAEDDPQFADIARQFLLSVRAWIRESYRTRQPQPFAAPPPPKAGRADACPYCRCVRVGGGFITVGWCHTEDSLCPSCSRFIDLNLAEREAVGALGYR